MSIETTNALRFLVTVNASPERAWHVFTAEIGSWWPSETHSIAADEGRRPDRVVLEPLDGGEIYEESATQSSYGSSGGWKAVLSPFEERFSPRAER